MAEPKWRVKNAPPGRLRESDMREAVRDLQPGELDRGTALGSPNPKEFARAGLPVSEAYRGVERPVQTNAAPPEGKFLGFMDSNDPSAWKRNPGVAGTAMAVLEMTNALLQIAPDDYPGVKELRQDIEEQKRRFWKSDAAGGFFGSGWAAMGRAAADLLLMTATGSAAQKAIPGGLNLLSKTGAAVPGMKSAGVVAAELAKRLNTTYVGNVMNSGVVGAGLGVTREAQEGQSKFEQAVIGSLLGAGLTGAVGAVPATMDLVKQYIGSSGLKFGKALFPFNSTAANTPNPQFSTPGYRYMSTLGKQNKTPLTVGQNTGNFEILNRERSALEQGLDDWQRLGQRQAAGVEAAAMRGVSQGVDPSLAGKGLQRTAGEIERNLIAAKNQNWEAIRAAAGGDPNARDMVMLPYMKALQKLDAEYRLQLSPREYEMVQQAIQRRMTQLTQAPGMQATGNELGALASTESRAAFSAGDRGLSADWHVSSMLKNAIDETIALNRQLKNPVAAGLERARLQYQADAGKIDAFRNSPLGRSLSEQTSPEAALRMITQSRSPEEVRRAMMYLDDADPFMAQAVRDSYKLGLVDRGRTPQNFVTGSTFSPTEFSKGQPRGRSADMPEELVHEAILGKRGARGMERAYELAGRVKLLEPDPQARHMVELTRQGQAMQVGGGLVAGQAGGTAPYAFRAGTLTGFPKLARYYLTDPKGQERLQRFTPWGEIPKNFTEWGGYANWPTASGVAGAVTTKPNAPDFPSEVVVPKPGEYEEQPILWRIKGN